ncbi:hypothetical protein [Burkholderia sp. BCC1999]|uniref:hypothetical protein n=1 Tax=Burkholderia sp. BCC1999 TaxID=2817448 RepID=UPI002AC344B3|nr:hypothetical protein [Burkholderia sp. BCC1999]
MDRECPDIGNSSDGMFALELDVEVRMPAVDLVSAGALAAETEAICPYAKMAGDVRAIGARQVAISAPEIQKGRLEADLFVSIEWCPGEDSVTHARPRLRLQAQPFEASRKARRRFASWA